MPPRSWPLTRKAVVYAWKVFRRYYLDLMGPYYGGPYRPRRWYRSDTTNVLSARAKYPAGFHAFVFKADADKCRLSELLGQHSSCEVRLVKLRGIVAVGTRDGLHAQKAPALVAKEMMICSDKDMAEAVRYAKR